MADVNKAELLIECGSCGAQQTIDLKTYQGKGLACKYCGQPLEVRQYLAGLMETVKNAGELPNIQTGGKTYRTTQEPVAVAWQTTSTTPSTGCSLGCGGLMAMLFVLIGIGVVGALVFFAISANEGINSIQDALGVDTAKSAEVSQMLTGHSSWINTVAYSPDGRYLASGSQDYTVRLWDVTTGDSIILPGTTYGAEDLEFSPDGSLLAGVDRSGMYLWEMPSGALIERQFADYYFSPSAVSFSADGEWLAYADSDTAIWEVATGEQVRALDGANLPNDILFSPDGKYIATINSGSDVMLWDMRGLLVKQMPNDAATEANLSFSPDGSILAYAGRDATTSDEAVFLYDIANDSTQQIVDEVFVLPYYVDFSPDGASLVVGDWTDKITVWDVDEREKLYEIEVETAIQDVIFSPDGAKVTAAGRNGRIYSWIVFPEKQQAVSDTPSDIPTLETPVCFVTAQADAQVYRNPNDANFYRIMNKDYQAEIDGKRFLSDVLWWHLRDGAWVRSDFVSAEAACDAVELVE